MKIAIIGSGAMGSLFGGKLAISGNDVTMIDVVPAVVEKLQKDGIQVEEEGVIRKASVHADTSDKVTGPFDLVILFTKTLYSRSALEAAKHFITEDTYLLSLQNGLGNDEILCDYVAKDHAMIGVTNFPSDLLGPGNVRTHKGGYVKFMSVDLKRNAMVEKLTEIFLQSEMDSSIADDIFVAVWEKAAFNAALNAPCAICNVPCGGIQKSEEGKSFASHIVDETVEVAHACGVNVSHERIMHSVEDALAHHTDHYPSMAQDVQRKRKTEVGFIDGAVVRYGKEKGIATPFTEAAYDLVKVIEANFDLR